MWLALSLLLLAFAQMIYDFAHMTKSILDSVMHSRIDG